MNKPVEIKRILPEQVKKGYELAEIKPVHKKWIHQEGDALCGCALSAMICSISKEAKKDFIVFSCMEINGWFDFLKRVSSTLGLDPDYIYGFVAGYDRENVEDRYCTGLSDRIKFALGYQDGFASSKLMLPEWSYGLDWTHALGNKNITLV